MAKPVPHASRGPVGGCIHGCLFVIIAAGLAAIGFLLWTLHAKGQL